MRTELSARTSQPFQEQSICSLSCPLRIATELPFSFAEHTSPVTAPPLPVLVLVPKPYLTHCCAGRHAPRRDVRAAPSSILGRSTWYACFDALSILGFRPGVGVLWSLRFRLCNGTNMTESYASPATVHHVHLNAKRVYTSSRRQLAGSSWQFFAIHAPDYGAFRHRLPRAGWHSLWPRMRHAFLFLSGSASSMTSRSVVGRLERLTDWR